MNNIAKIAILGNSCGGKTKLSRHLHKLYSLPLIHVDSIQFTPGLKFRPYKESIEILKAEQQKTRWIIDGFGPLDILEDRLKAADLIIMIDLPVYIHYFWAIKRVVKNVFIKQRSELPDGSSERKLQHIFKLFKTIHQIHTKMRPELLRILNRDHYVFKTMTIQSARQLNEYLKKTNR